MEREFAGLTAIVTGAGSGIGLEVAKGLTEKGARVFGFDINEGQMGSNATFIKCDIGDSTSVKWAGDEFIAPTKMVVTVYSALINASECAPQP